MWGDFLKIRRVQRLGVYCGIMKKGDKAGNTENVPISIDKMYLTRSLPGVRGYCFWAACYAKMVPKRCLLKSSEHRKGHQKTFVYKARDWDPLKRFRGAVLKNMKKQ